MGRGAPAYLLLHAGVADSRSWEAVAPALDGPAVAYDRRGFGGSPPGPEGFRHVDDLLAVLDAVGAGGPVWLVGNSMGGALAIDAALEAPERVRGARADRPGREQRRPGWEEPPTTPPRAMEAEWKAAGEDDSRSGWSWTPGSGSTGRSTRPGGGAARELAIDMNRQRLRARRAGRGGVQPRRRRRPARRAALPVTVAWGEHENSSSSRSASCWSSDPGRRGA